MTTIAWDGKTLAADRQVSCPSGNLQVVKIRRTRDGRLIGATGDTVLTRLYLDWLESGDGSARPTFADDKEDYVVALEVLPDGSVLRHDRFGCFPILGSQATCGSGGAFARGALAAGMTAAQAVAIACQLDGGSGGPVDALKLKRAK